MFPAVLISVLVIAAFSAVILITANNARKRQPASVAVDLGGRLPAKRRRPCGRHGEGGGNCDDCGHRHEHHDHDGHCRKHEG